MQQKKFAILLNKCGGICPQERKTKTEIRIIETSEMVELEGNEWTQDAELNENDEYEMTEENYDWWEEYLSDRKSDQEEINKLAEELGIEVSEIQDRLNEECNPIDADSEHSEKQRVLAEIKAKYKKTQLLKDAIKKSGYKVEYIFTQMGLSRNGFYKKLNGETPFKDYEIKRLSELLKLTNDEIIDIFL